MERIGDEQLNTMSMQDLRTACRERGITIGRSKDACKRLIREWQRDHPVEENEDTDMEEDSEVEYVSENENDNNNQVQRAVGNLDGRRVARKRNNTEVENDTKINSMKRQKVLEDRKIGDLTQS